MRTTVDIDDRLLAEAKAVAQVQRRSVRSLIEEGLRLAIHKRHTDVEPFSLPLSTAGGEPKKDVDYSRHSALLDVMEEDSV